MGKRSNFERVERDFYPTPLEAVRPLIPHLPKSFLYVEPCAGKGDLIRHIKELTKGGGQMVHACDIEWPGPHMGISEGSYEHYTGNDADFFITNPPWSRDILHPLILHLSDLAPTWLLFDADWMHTKQAIPYLKRCEKIVSVGRVKWIPDSKTTGKDNCCWYLFVANVTGGPTFYGRTL